MTREFWLCACTPFWASLNLVWWGMSTIDAAESPYSHFPRQSRFSRSLAMRGVLSVGLILLALAAATMIAAQTGSAPNEKPTGAKAKPKIEAAEKPAASGTVRATLA